MAQGIGAGFNASEEREAGCLLAEMAAGLRALRADGLAATEAATVGFNKIEMRAAGYTPEEIGEVLSGQRVQDGVTASQARGLGYTPDEIRAAGYPDPELAKAASEVKDEGQSAREAYALSSSAGR